jgi:hypothetical protein
MRAWRNDRNLRENVLNSARCRLPTGLNGGFEVGTFGDVNRFEEFLDYIQRGEGDQRSFSKVLGFEMTQADKDVLFRLSRACCFPPWQLDAPVPEHWDKRRNLAAHLIKLSTRVTQIVNDLRFEEAWIDTRFEVCGRGRVATAVSATDRKEYIFSLYGLEEVLAKLKPTLLDLTKKRKPRAEDESNYYLYLMAAYLLRRGAVSQIAIHEVLANYVTAWRTSEDRDDSAVDAECISIQIRRFGDRNSEFAGAIDSDPFRHVKDETGIDVPST